MYPPTNTQTGPKTSTETTTFALYNLTLSYFTQTDLTTTITAIFAKIYAKLDDAVKTSLQPL